MCGTFWVDQLHQPPAPPTTTALSPGHDKTKYVKTHIKKNITNQIFPIQKKQTTCLSTHLASDAVLVVPDLVPAEAHAGALASDHLVVPDDRRAGAAVDARRVLVELARAVVGLDDGVHRALLDIDTLVALETKKKEQNKFVKKTNITV